MQLALARCFADPTVTAVLVDPLVSNTRVHRFYEQLGFRCVDRRQFGDDDCFVCHLSREDWHSKVTLTADKTVREGILLALWKK